MNKVYKFEISLTVDTAHKQEIIAKAQKVYSERRGDSNVDDDGRERPLPGWDAITGIDNALMELMGTFPALDVEGIDLAVRICDTDDSARDVVEIGDDQGQQAVLQLTGHSTDGSTGNEAKAPAPEGLDEFETGTYLCRWPNGDFSVVAAANKREALVELDEWDAAHPSQVQAIDSFMVDFTLTDEGRIVLKQFSEATREIVWDSCYPELQKVLHSDGVTDYSGGLQPGGAERVLQAVKHERARLWEDQPIDEARTELGKRIAKATGASGTVADYYVENAKRILESEDGEVGNPHS
jgi:hypothetical protein